MSDSHMITLMSLVGAQGDRTCPPGSRERSCQESSDRCPAAWRTADSPPIPYMAGQVGTAVPSQRRRHICPKSLHH